MKITLVAGMHGNERAPVEALLGAGLSFILGNPRAYEKNVRYTESDLNASFGILSNTYEAKRAREILSEIPSQARVADFHTTSAVTPPFAIVVDEKMIPFAQTTGLEHIVIMKHNIKSGHALINYRDGISIESGQHGTQKSRDMTLRIVESIRRAKPHPAKIYEVFGEITEAGTYKNFRHHHGGFIPVLAGEVSYPFYGLKAREVSR